jgi:hypothetical protein
VGKEGRQPGEGGEDNIVGRVKDNLWGGWGSGTNMWEEWKTTWQGKGAGDNCL